MTTTLQAYTVSQVMADYRNTTATYTDNTGTLQDAGINTLLLGYDPTTLLVRGYQAREQRTNLVTNPRGVGAVVGTPGTLPTNWSATVSGGMSLAVAGFGQEAGIDYVDLNFSGTPTSVGPYFFYFDGTEAAPVTPGLTYAVSMGFRLSGGSLTNVRSTVLDVVGMTSAGAQNEVSASTVVNLGSTITRYTKTWTPATGSVYGRLALACTLTATGIASAFTVRCYLPQLELGSFTSTYVRPPAGTTGSSTRGADDIRMSLQPGWLDPNTNTFVIEANILQTAPSGQDQGLFRLDDGTNNNSFTIYNAAGTSNVMAQLTVGGTQIALITLGSFVPGSPFRAIVGFSIFTGANGTFLAGLVSGGNYVSSNVTATSVPVFNRALVGRSSLNAGTFAANGATHANGYIAEVMFSGPVATQTGINLILSQNAMLYLSQMNLTVGALLTASGVVLG